MDYRDWRITVARVAIVVIVAASLGVLLWKSPGPVSDLFYTSFGEAQEFNATLNRTSRTALSFQYETERMWPSGYVVTPIFPFYYAWSDDSRREGETLAAWINVTINDRPVMSWPNNAVGIGNGSTWGSFVRVDRKYMAEDPWKEGENVVRFDVTTIVIGTPGAPGALHVRYGPIQELYDEQDADRNGFGDAHEPYGGLSPVSVIFLAWVIAAPLTWLATGAAARRFARR